MWKIGICKIVSSRQYRLRQNLKSIILHITSCTSRGFTLIELLVALAIISIIFSFVIPKLMGVKEAELRGASRQLLYTVRRLSDEALFKKEKRVLAIDIKNGEYWEENSGKKLKLPDTIHIKDVVAGKGARTSGITTLAFFPSGLRDEAMIHLSDKDKEYTIVIPALGERFEIHEEGNNK